MEAEKKFFSINGVEYSIIRGKRWYVEYYHQHPSGVKERKRLYNPINRGKTDEEKYRRAVQLIRELAAGIRAGDQSLLIRTLKNNQAQFRRKTFQTYTSRIAYFTTWLKENAITESGITPSQANQFIMHALAHKSPGTVRGYRRTLVSLYNKFDKTNNPFADSYCPPKSYKSLQYYNDDQIKRLSTWLSANLPEVWLAAQIEYYCFIRPNTELRLLEVNDINIDHGFIEIRAEISKNKKTQKVSIPTALEEPLLQFIKGKTGLLFSKNGKPRGQNFFNYQHSKALKALSITGRYAFYSWKHTGVVKAVRAGINIKDIQLQLRHHSLDMVNEYLKNLGVMDSEALKDRFPALGGATRAFEHKNGCSCQEVQTSWKYCPECGVKLPEAAA